MENKKEKTGKKKYASNKYVGTPFHTRIRELLDPDKHPEYSQTELASKLDVNPQAVQQYYSGATYPSLDKMGKIAEYFDVSVDYLLGRTDTKALDSNVQAVCKYTGLTEDAVSKLHNLVSSTEQLELLVKAKDLTKEELEEKISSITGEMPYTTVKDYIDDMCFLYECTLAFINSIIKTDKLNTIAYNAYRFCDKQEDYLSIMTADDFRNLMRYKNSVLLDQVCEEIEREFDFDKSFKHTQNIRNYYKNESYEALFEPLSEPIYDPEEV